MPFARRWIGCWHSPRYGEKWGRYWLDVVRYADTAGETADYPVPDAWRYRNYVINAFNADKPYDQFIAEQLAGIFSPQQLPPEQATNDMPNSSPRQVTSRLPRVRVRRGRRIIFSPLKTRSTHLERASWAHHRLRPLSRSQVRSREREGLLRPLWHLRETRYPHPGCEKDKAPHDFVPLVPATKMGETATAIRGLVGAAAGIRVERVVTKTTPQAYAVWEGSPHDAQIQNRGDPNTRGPAIPRRFLTVLGGQTLAPNSGSGRLALAGWVADPKNPLTARVMVNRIWAGILAPDWWQLRTILARAERHPLIPNYWTGWHRGS